jgi:hypothetical protein
MDVSMTFLDRNWFVAFQLAVPIVQPSSDIGSLIFLVMAKPVVLSTFTDSNSVKRFAYSVSKVFGGHQWLENLLFVPFNAFLVMELVH